MLKKWYKYNAGTIRAWAKAYSKEHSIDMELEFLNRDGEVYMPNAMLEAQRYNVSLHQETWQWKNAMKDYRIMYFGEPKIEAFGGGPLAKAAAEDKYAAISADAGTLRVQIEKD